MRKSKELFMYIRQTFSLLFVVSLFAAPLEAFGGEYENPPGWKWLIEPMKINVRSSLSKNEIILISSIGETGAFTLTIGWKPEERSHYRPVVLDSLKQRYLSDRAIGAGTDDMMMIKYEWTEIDVENISTIGFEVLTPEGWLVVSKEAINRAHQMNIKVLPYPQLGKPFEFDLNAYGGGFIRSLELRGKVLVLDCWATWCKPCMKTIPEIQAIQKMHTPLQLEVIGINYDFNTDLLQKALSQHEIDWRTVHVPPDPSAREVWFESSSINQIPRFFVLDQDGILRLDTTDIDKLKSMIAQLNGKSKRVE